MPGKIAPGRSTDWRADSGRHRVIAFLYFLHPFLHRPGGKEGWRAKRQKMRVNLDIYINYISKYHLSALLAHLSQGWPGVRPPERERTAVKEGKKCKKVARPATATHCTRWPPRSRGWRAPILLRQRPFCIFDGTATRSRTARSVITLVHSTIPLAGASGP
jgi:hypothetical protein